MQYYQYEFDNKDRHNLGVNPHYYIPLPHFQLPKSCALLVGQRWSELEYPSVHTKTTGRVGCSGAANYGSLWKAGYPKIPRSGSPWFFSMAFHGHNLQKITNFSTSLDKLMDCPHLVGGWPTPLKMMEVVSWDYDILMTFPTEWKVIKFHGSGHHQPAIRSYQHDNSRHISNDSSSTLLKWSEILLPFLNSPATWIGATRSCDTIAGPWQKTRHLDLRQGYLGYRWEMRCVVYTSYIYIYIYMLTPLVQVSNILYGCEMLWIYVSAIFSPLWSLWIGYPIGFLMRGILTMVKALHMRGLTSLVLPWPICTYHKRGLNHHR